VKFIAGTSFDAQGKKGSRLVARSIDASFGRPAAVKGGLGGITLGLD